MKRRLCAAVGRAGALCVWAAITAQAWADDWTNSGGNAGRNGVTREAGPDAADPLWSGGRSSIIAWQPVIAGCRVFMVRQTGFPPEPASNESTVVAMDLDSGAELWFRNIPYNSGDWTTWIAGVSNNQVYVSRSGNGASVSARMYALDAATGATVWPSQDLIDAGAYDGVVFADNGDPIVASFRKIWRIRATDGTTAWVANRVASVSGNCGGAIGGNAVYVADAVAGGNSIKKFNLTTGAFQYQSPVMAGFTIQTTPMVGPDGTIYLQRVQNNAGVDFFYAIADTGVAMTIKWSVPAGYCTSSEFTIGEGGSVYMWAPGNVVKRLDPVTGATINTSAIIPADFAAPRMASDRYGRIFFSNGAFSNGRFYSFNADLTPRWDTAVANINIGAPSMGRLGTLVICGVGTDVRAYRTPRCPADYNGDGFVDGIDSDEFNNDFEAGDPQADFNCDGFVDGIDSDLFNNAFETLC